MIIQLEIDTDRYDPDAVAMAIEILEDGRYLSVGPQPMGSFSMAERSYQQPSKLDARMGFNATN